MLSSKRRHLEADRTFLAVTHVTTTYGNKAESSRTAQKRVIKDGRQYRGSLRIEKLSNKK